MCFFAITTNKGTYIEQEFEMGKFVVQCSQRHFSEIGLDQPHKLLTGILYLHSTVHGNPIFPVICHSKLKTTPRKVVSFRQTGKSTSTSKAFDGGAIRHIQNPNAL